MRPLRLVPDDTKIQFMRGRFAGVIVSAVLSTLSIVLFFYPGLNLGVDFRGGILVELRGSQPLQTDAIRAAFAPLGFGDLRVQEFGSPQDVLVRFENNTHLQNAQSQIATQVTKALPDVQIRRVEVVGATVSAELFRNGLLATGLALVAVLIYIWFRFEWQFGIGVVATLILDVTKTVGFFGVTQFQFDLTSVAALLTLIGYSVTDKVVVYDRIRENLAKHRTMPLRQLIDLSINQNSRAHRCYIANGVPVDLAACGDRRRGYARLCIGDLVRDRRGYILIDFYRFADFAVFGGEAAAARDRPGGALPPDAGPIACSSTVAFSADRFAAAVRVLIQRASRGPVSVVATCPRGRNWDFWMPLTRRRGRVSGSSASSSLYYFHSQCCWRRNIASLYLTKSLYSLSGTASFREQLHWPAGSGSRDPR